MHKTFFNNFQEAEAYYLRPCNVSLNHSDAAPLLCAVVCMYGTFKRWQYHCYASDILPIHTFSLCKMFQGSLLFPFTHDNFMQNIQVTIDFAKLLNVFGHFTNQQQHTILNFYIHFDSHQYSSLEILEIFRFSRILNTYCDTSFNLWPSLAHEIPIMSLKFDSILELCMRIPMEIIILTSFAEDNLEWQSVN